MNRPLGGRFVAFHSSATNLTRPAERVSKFYNGRWRVFG